MWKEGWVLLWKLDFDTRKTQFVYDAEVLVDYGSIPDALVIKRVGQKWVQITGIDDKSQITAVYAATKTGNFLPIQVGKTKRYLSLSDFPEDWLVTCTENHWANEKTTIGYIYKILLPYVKQKKREELNFHSDHPALVVFDRFKA